MGEGVILVDLASHTLVLVVRTLVGHYYCCGHNSVDLASHTLVLVVRTLVGVILVNNIWEHMIGAMDSRNFFLASQRRSNLRPESRIVASFAQDVGTFYSKPHRFVHANLGCFGSIYEAWFHSMDSAYFVG